MNFLTVITSSYAYLDQFDYDHYPLCFSRFEAVSAPLFQSLSQNTLSQDVDSLLNGLDEKRRTLSRRKQKEQLDADKLILALFLSPAAQRAGEAATLFAEMLCARWNERHPRFRYQLGQYEAILKGFDSNLLGLPLRKSRQH